MKKVLYSDLDGTLLSFIDGKLSISDENLKSIKEWIDNGNYFSIATGRNISSMESLLKGNIVVNFPMVLSNGAVIYDMQKEKILYRNYLEETFVAKMMTYIKNQREQALILSTEDQYYIVFPSDQKNLPVVDFKANQLLAENASIMRFTKAILLIHPKNFSKTLSAINELDFTKDVNIIPSSNRFIEFVKQDINKAEGILKAIEMRGLKNYQLCSIGDYYNDEAMLLHSHIKGVPNDGHPEIKRLSTYLLPNHDEHAVSIFIHKILNETED